MARISQYTKDGETFYKVRVYVGKDPITGKDKYVIKNGLKNKEEAKVAAVQIQAEI